MTSSVQYHHQHHVQQNKPSSSSSSVSEQIGYVIEKITSKLQKSIESLGRAKLIVRYVRQLKAIISDERNLDSISSLMYTTNIYGYIMVSHNKILTYGILADETLRCLLPILRQKSTHRHKLMHQLVDHGSIVFALSALRMFETDQSIRVQALELLSYSIEFVTETEEGDELGSRSAHDVIHQLIFNGNAKNSAY